MSENTSFGPCSGDSSPSNSSTTESSRSRIPQHVESLQAPTEIDFASKGPGENTDEDQIMGADPSTSCKTDFIFHSHTPLSCSESQGIEGQFGVDRNTLSEYVPTSNFVSHNFNPSSHRTDLPITFAENSNATHSIAVNYSHPLSLPSVPLTVHVSTHDKLNLNPELHISMLTSILSTTEESSAADDRFIRVSPTSDELNLDSTHDRNSSHCYSISLGNSSPPPTSSPPRLFSSPALASSQTSDVAENPLDEPHAVGIKEVSQEAFLNKSGYGEQHNSVVIIDEHQCFSGSQPNIVGNLSHPSTLKSSPFPRSQTVMPKKASEQLEHENPIKLDNEIRQSSTQLPQDPKLICHSLLEQNLSSYGPLSTSSSQRSLPPSALSLSAEIATYADKFVTSPPDVPSVMEYVASAEYMISNSYSSQSSPPSSPLPKSSPPPPLSSSPLVPSEPSDTDTFNAHEISFLQTNCETQLPDLDRGDKPEKAISYIAEMNRSLGKRKRDTDPDTASLNDEESAFQLQVKCGEINSPPLISFVRGASKPAPEFERESSVCRSRAIRSHAQTDQRKVALPNPKRSTAAAQKLQHKKLTTPFRSPVLKRPKLESLLVDHTSRGLSLTIEESKSTAHVQSQVSETSLSVAAPIDTKKKYRTPRAGGQFKSPLSVDASTKAGMLVRLTPTIQALERKLQLLKRAIKVREDRDEKVLEDLVKKWTEAGREVAWEVWELVKDNVSNDDESWPQPKNRSTGESFKGCWGWDEKGEQRERNWGWDVVPHGSHESDFEESQSVVNKSLEKEEEKSKDTLGTMLMQLGIAPDTLGWDEEDGVFVGE